MLLITLQIGLLLTVIILPLKTKKSKSNNRYKVDTDTGNSQYAVNENGMLEKISPLKTSQPKPPIAN